MNRVAGRRCSEDTEFGCIQLLLNLRTNDSQNKTLKIIENVQINVETQFNINTFGFLFFQRWKYAPSSSTVQNLFSQSILSEFNIIVSIAVSMNLYYSVVFH